MDMYPINVADKWLQTYRDLSDGYLWAALMRNYWPWILGLLAYFIGMSMIIEKFIWRGRD